MNASKNVSKAESPALRIVEAVAPELEARAESHDGDGSFVEGGFRLLRQAGFFEVGVPSELGGGGASHGELCEALRRMAHACPSTALAASMHTHLVAAAVWKHVHGKGGTALLEKVAKNRLVLVSTGANDWLESNGTLERVDGGYRVTGFKPFASGSPAGDVMITSAAYDDPDEGAQVLHFPVPLSAEGVTVRQDWDALGMRGTGSNTIALEGVFIPEESIVMRRPRQGWHPAWSVVLTVAIPIFTAPYVGIAEQARELAIEKARPHAAREHVPFLVGEMENALATARLAWRDAVGNAADYDFAPEASRANRALVDKTLIAKSTRAAVEAAMEAVGGSAYFRRTGIERLLRDVCAAGYHPLPEKRQQLFTGRIALGLDPV